jgi:lipoyl synthase
MRKEASRKIPEPGALPALEVIDLGRLDYDKALAVQKRLAAERMADEAPDRLLLVEHPPVITMGQTGTTDDLRVAEQMLREKGVPLFHTDRGGRATFHGPGQLVAYPILKLRDKDLHAYLERMLAVVVAVLDAYGLPSELGVRGPGVWVRGGKIASIGMAVRKWVTYHGVALNVNTDLHWFDLIDPCGHPEERMTSMKRELDAALDLHEVSKRYVREFCRVFSFAQPASVRQGCPTRPDWLRVAAVSAAETGRIEQLLTRLHLGTVCQEADCPNIGECFSRGTATFMILGTVCTRGCRYCAVAKGLPDSVDPEEPEHVGEAVASLGIRHAVITSVTRDDLPDGGADQFVRTIGAVRERCPDVSVEVLVPDFAGSEPALGRVCDARPDVFNHNIETVRRLFPTVRPRASYDLSLQVLARAASQGLAVKSGLMLGLGETGAEINDTLTELKAAGCRYLTLGQYLAPSPAHAPIDRYVSPKEFEHWAETARAMGFASVASGPLVRSSYRAEAMVPTRSAQPVCENAT